MPVRRGFAGLALAVFLLGGTIEPITGDLRDGDVHHEALSSAAVHASGALAGEHGHEDAADSSVDHSHTPDHQHGTGQDHCTHLHGLFVAPVLTLSWIQAVATDGERPDMTPLSHPPTHSTPPPRA